MTAPLFACATEDLSADPILLDGAEGHHAADVVRLRTGDPLRITDGKGLVADCVVMKTSRGSVLCAVRTLEEVPVPQPRCTVVQALAKGERVERAIEAMTEVGVDAFVPWRARRSVVTWEGARADRGPEKWRVIAAAAAKQSRRVHFPAVTAVADIDAVVARVKSAALAVICHPVDGIAVHQLVPPRTDDLVIVVGPEGGLTDEELQALSAAGGQVGGLGPTVLRSTSAGVVAATLLLAASGRFDRS